jgi:hypothetical protein
MFNFLVLVSPLSILVFYLFLCFVLSLFPSVFLSISHRKKLQFPISPVSSKPLSYKEKEELEGEKCLEEKKRKKQ